ncbi:MAG: glycoside hydrolase [Muribaculaceae bacterium]|nr:glycoside hydrolase [Muribaculaceae bacterium]
MRNFVLSIMAAMIAALTLPAAATTYNIIDYGARADTTVLSTAAIQGAIDAAAAAGGGRVTVPPGQWVTGSIFLKSGVELHLEQGATLLGSTDIADYTPVSTDYLSLRTHVPTIQLIYADNVDNVAITGRGTIDGRGRGFPKLSWNDEGMTRPHLLRFINSRDITVSGVTLRNSGCWMQHYLACDRLRITDLTIFNRNNYNNDALDLDGCHDVVVAGLIADSDDDGITLKSTSPRLCENIVISNCVVSSHCNAIKLGTETNGGFRNIVIRGITVKPSADQSSLFFGRPIGSSAISLEIVDGGVMQAVDIADITVSGTESPIFIRLGNRARPYAEGIPVEGVGTIDGVTIHDVIVNNAGPIGCSITGIEGHPVRNVTLRNIAIHHAGGVGVTPVPDDEKIAEYPEATMWGNLPARGFWLNHTENVTIEGLTVTTDAPDARPLIVE